jgi:hypothetical protein
MGGVYAVPNLRGGGGRRVPGMVNTWQLGGCGRSGGASLKTRAGGVDGVSGTWRMITENY